MASGTTRCFPAHGSSSQNCNFLTGPYVPGTPTRGPVVVTFTCDDPEGTYPSSLRITKTTTLALRPEWHCGDYPRPEGFPLVIVIDRQKPTCNVVLTARRAVRDYWTLGVPMIVTARTNGSDNIAGPLFRQIIAISPAANAGPTLPHESQGDWLIVGLPRQKFVFTGRVTDQAGNVKECTATFRAP